MMANVNIDTFLDDAHSLISQGEITDGIATVFKGLFAKRMAMPPEDWRKFVAAEALTHPVKEAVHSCPFTRHSFTKPRGYAGDAGLIDLIYHGISARNIELDGIAEEIAKFTLNAPAARAVRYRRELLARYIDETAAQENEPLILSIAAGHLREIELSQAALNGQIGRLYAIDQDKESVALIQREYGRYNVSASVGSVRQILNGKIKFNGLSLVYAAGLFDYLPDNIAQRLIEHMFSFLKPGGRMLVANFLPQIPDIGYMESYMDWHLIFRSADELLRLFDSLPQNKVESLITTFDPDKNIVFVEAVKNRNNEAPVRATVVQHHAAEAT
ncbi:MULTISPECIES: class I SAM-dependent methyltransferase [Methylococcus]|uniref:class I SAM-dependent methyltransferase n=1 Tax=Methylococcus TaxID=413 RepID=UPI001C52D364|nr:class I SAM-dependent methyltransferase [Methylococcus capsulatus]QXP90168.1 hypothetical protein KW114_14095 [Methylococcus capsulatus]